MCKLALVANALVSLRILSLNANVKNKIYIINVAIPC